MHIGGVPRSRYVRAARENAGPRTQYSGRHILSAARTKGARKKCLLYSVKYTDVGRLLKRVSRPRYWA